MIYLAFGFLLFGLSIACIIKGLKELFDKD